MATRVESLPANAEDLRGVDSTSGSGRSLQEEMATYSSILTWRIPWTEEPGGLQSIGSKSPTQLKQLSIPIPALPIQNLSALLASLGHSSIRVHCLLLKVRQR